METSGRIPNNYLFVLLGFRIFAIRYRSPEPCSSLLRPLHLNLKPLEASDARSLYLNRDLGLKVWGLGFRVSGFRFGASGLGFRAEGSGFRVSGLGFRVPLGKVVSHQREELMFQMLTVSFCKIWAAYRVDFQFSST